jgi:hypothetical protein
MSVVSIVGALLVLYAFIASHTGWMSSEGKLYAWLNCIGTGMLAMTVLDPFNAGVFLVEGTWCLFSFYLVVKRHV